MHSFMSFIHHINPPPPLSPPQTHPHSNILTKQALVTVLRALDGSSEQPHGPGAVAADDGRQGDPALLELVLKALVPSALTRAVVR
jgi:hypothetical protein